jgi:hypothetical protein
MRTKLASGLFAAMAAGALAAAQPVRVTIDVKPGDEPTMIEPNREGMLPVVVLSSPTFEASTIDRASITLGPTGTEATPVRSMVEDANKDGRQDVMVLVRVQDLALKCGDTVIQLKASTTAGVAVEGSEKIVTEGCAAP